MTSPTPHGQVPEALNQLFEKLEDCIYEWSNYVRADDAPTTLPKYTAGPIKDLRVSVAELYHRTAHVQKTAKNEHVADDVSKNGAESNMGAAYAELPKDVIRAVFIENGFTVKEGQTDLKQYVYDAANELLRRARLRASHGQAPVGYINRGIAPHTKGKTVFHEAPTINLEHRWWSQDEPVFLASHGQAPAGAAPWRSAVLDLIDECPGLTVEQDRWLSRRVKELDFASAPRPNAQPAPATQQAGERVYAFRRKGLADFCTCDEARYEELSNKPHLFETRIFYAAPQPSPTAQAADNVPALDRDRIREIFMAHGFTVKEGRADLKQYVYDAADALLRAARAPAESVGRDAPAAGAVAGPMDELAELSLLNRLIELGNKAAGAHATSNSDDGHKGTAAYVEWQELRAEMGELIRTAYAAAPTPAAQADSVLEDAARWREFTSRFNKLTPANGDALCAMLGMPNSSSSLHIHDIDAWFDAARKQGGA